MVFGDRSHHATLCLCCKSLKLVRLLNLENTLINYLSTNEYL